MKIIAAIQARMGSKRLPGKPMKKLAEKPLLYYVIQRVKKARTLNQVVLVTSTNRENYILQDVAKQLGIEVFRGSEEDVLGRFVGTAEKYDADVIVRVCADNPLISPEEIDRIVKHHMKSKADYSFNHIPAMGNNYPDGLGAEVINFSVLQRIAEISNRPEDREHVTRYIWDHQKEFKIETIKAPQKIAGPDIKLDIDTPEDFNRIEGFIKTLTQENVFWASEEIVKAYRDHFKTKTVVLLEDDRQVCDYIKWEKNLGGQKTVIALSPFAVYELERRNMPYRLIEEYYDQDELYQLGIENFNRIENICDLIDGTIQKKINRYEDLGITPARFSILPLKMLYDAVTIRIFQLSKMIESEAPSCVFIYSKKEFPPRDFLLFDNRESIYAKLLSLPVWKSSIVIFPAISDKKSLENKSFKSNLIKIIEKNPVLYDIVTTIKKNGISGLFNSLKIRFNKNSVILCGGGYNWDYSREELIARGVGPIVRLLDSHSTVTVENGSFEAIWMNLKNNKEFLGFFNRQDKINFFPILESRFELLTKSIAPNCLKIYDETCKIIKNKNVKALLSTSFSRYRGHVVALSARNSGVPVINWQHGSFGFAEQPILTYIDLIMPNIDMVNGIGVVERYERDASRYNTVLLPIGASSLEKLYKEFLESSNQINQRKTVLYATTTYYQNYLYISLYPPFSDNTFWHVQKGIVELIGTNKDYKAIIKLHQTLEYREPPLRDYAREKGFQNCLFIRTERSFTDLLQSADIIVLDFASTTLLQSLTTKKPIFLYTGHLHIDKKALEMLKKRVYCYLNLDEFLEALNDFLSGKHIGKVDYNNTEFLEYYGMYKLDGKAGERAANTVKTIIETWEKDRQRKA